MESIQTQSIDVLNSFLRGELAAVDTYRQALERIEPGTSRSRLLDCMHSHESRAATLQDRIRALGGQPAHSAGLWGTVTKLLEGGAKVFGEKAAISALEEGEDHGKNQYREDVAKLDSVSRTLVETQLIPEQARTHDSISALKHTVAHSSSHS